MLILLKKFRKVLPYIAFISVGALLYFFYWLSAGDLRNLALNLLSDDVFALIAFTCFDQIRFFIQREESKYIEAYIKTRIANDTFTALNFQKKILHGYDLNNSKLGKIIGITQYSEDEIKNLISSQKYLGFQVFKSTDEVRLLFDEVLNNNLVLKYSGHLEIINLLRITNNLSLLEVMLKNERNFEPPRPESSEFTIINGKDISPDNPDRYILLKKGPQEDTFVVYDSGAFEKQHLTKLLNEYVLKGEAADQVARVLYHTLSLMKAWIPDATYLRKNESRFRIIKQLFAPAMKVKSNENDLYFADIIHKK